MTYAHVCAECSTQLAAPVGMCERCRSAMLTKMASDLVVARASVRRIQDKLHAVGPAWTMGLGIEAWHVGVFVVLFAATVVPGFIVLSDAIFHWSAP